MHKINISIVGAGLIGRKRAECLQKNSQACLKSVYDINKEAARDFSLKYGCDVAENIPGIICDPAVDLVILAIIHKDAANLAPLILEKKHLLMEKPVGRNLSESERIIEAARISRRKLFAGFNYRCYPHIQKALKYVTRKKIGDIISSSFTIGHSAFPGYETTWKMDKDLCGGGVVLDPGVHMLDLMLLFFKSPVSFQSNLNSLGWKTGVEDEAFINFIFSDKSISQHHYSLNMPKNTFMIEITGTSGLIRISGRGGNYGPMSFTYVPRWFWKSGRKIIEEEFPGEDQSFLLELNGVISSIQNNVNQDDKYLEFLEVMKLADNIYRSHNNS